MRRSKVSLIFAVFGILLFLTGLVWLYVNFTIDRNGSRAAEETVSKLRQLFPVSMNVPVSTEDDAVQFEEPVEDLLPDYVIAPLRDMPVRNVDGVDYIGQLSLPSLSLDLPVASDWSYDTLTVSPCRYYGSAYTHNLVILAHSYSRHFGKLNQLTEGDEIILTDMDGNVFRYHVQYMETLKPDAVLDVVDSEFELSLFTCTANGTMRLCIRCSLFEDIPFQYERGY